MQKVIFSEKTEKSLNKHTNLDSKASSTLLFFALLRATINEGVLVTVALTIFQIRSLQRFGRVRRGKVLLTAISKQKRNFAAIAKAPTLGSLKSFSVTFDFRIKEPEASLIAEVVDLP
jgi:hypothetical protein